MSFQPIIVRALIVTLFFFGVTATATITAVSLFPQQASAQCCPGGPCGACDVCGLLPSGCYFQGFYESYYQSYYESYYQSYYEGYYQSYYEGYYQGYYQSYYEGYYESYYESYYQSYYEGAYTLGPDLVATYLSPASATAGSVTLQGRATNSGDTATGSFTSYFEVQGNGTLSWTGAATLAAGANTTVSASRTFSAGSYQVRLCVDGAGTVAESNEGNNCSSWTTLTVSAAAGGGVSGTLTANPTTIAVGESSTLTWSSTGATSCSAVGAGFSTGGATSGTDTVSPATVGDHTYQAVCTDGSNTDTASATVTVGAGGACPGTDAADITATPNRVEPGGSTTLEWTGSDISSCTLTNVDTGAVVDTSTATLCSVSDSLAVSNIQAQATYRITCGSAFKDIVVNVIPRFEEF